jgi:uncharacterized RDD family membrane protein YckC
MTGLTHPAVVNNGPQLDNRRVLAAAVDVLLLAPVAVLMAMLTGGFGGTSAALTVAWALFYYFALESAGGQTVGKRLLRLRVVRSDGSEAGLREVAVRTVLRTVDGLFGYLVGLGVMLATGQRRQRLGDLAAGTVVTSADAEQPRPTATPAVEAPPSDLDFDPVDEAPAVEEDEDGVPMVEELEPEIEDEQAPTEELAVDAPDEDGAPVVAEDADPIAEEDAEPVATGDAESVGSEDAEPVASEDEEPGPSVEVAEPLSSVEVAEPDSDEDEPVAAVEVPAEAPEPAPAEDEPTSVGNGIEIVSAIDMIMADARESAERDHAREGAGDQPDDDAGDAPAAS